MTEPVGSPEEVIAAVREIMAEIDWFAVFEVSDVPFTEIDPLHIAIRKRTAAALAALAASPEEQ